MAASSHNVNALGPALAAVATRHPTNADDRDKIEKHQIAQGQGAFELWRRFFSHVRNLGLL